MTENNFLNLLTDITENNEHDDVEDYLIDSVKKIKDNLRAECILLIKLSQNSQSPVFCLGCKSKTVLEETSPKVNYNELHDSSPIIFEEEECLTLQINSSYKSDLNYIIRVSKDDKLTFSKKWEQLLTDTIARQCDNILLKLRKKQNEMFSYFKNITDIKIYDKLAFEYDLQIDKFTWSRNVNIEKYGIDLKGLSSMKDILTLLPSGKYEDLKEKIIRVIERDERHIFDFPIFDAQKRKILLRCYFEIVKNDRNQPIKFVGLLQDITHKNKIHKKLEESELKFNHLAENLDEVLYLRTKDKVLYVSSSIKKLLGVGPKEFINKYSITLDYIHPDDLKIVEKHKDTFNEGRLSLKYRIITKQGAVKWIWIRTSAFKIGIDETRFIGIITDITEQKLMEERLLEEKEKALNSLEVKNKFLSMMSHEIRTPISTIISFNDSLPEYIRNQINDKLLDDFSKSANHLNNVFNDILYYSELSSNVYPLIKEKFLLQKLIQAIREEFKYRFKEKGLVLSIESQDAPPVILNSHFDSIYHILNYLLNNSLKYTHEGGATLKLAWNMEESVFSIVLRDTGIGIIAENLDRVFNPFFTTNNHLGKTESGTGLGLAIVKELLNKLNGKIEIESQFKQGTNISIELPVKIERISSVRYLSTYKSSHVLFNEKYVNGNIEFGGVRVLKYLKMSKINKDTVLIIDWNGANTNEVIEEKEWINTHFKKVIVIVRTVADIEVELPKHWEIKKDDMTKNEFENLLR